MNDNDEIKLAKPQDRVQFDFNGEKVDIALVEFLKNARPLSAKELRKLRNTKIFALLFFVGLASALIVPNKSLGGTPALLGFISGLIWLVRKGHIFYARQ